MKKLKNKVFLNKTKNKVFIIYFFNNKKIKKQSKLMKPMIMEEKFKSNPWQI